MKTVTLLEFPQDAEGALRRVAEWERFVPSHRRKPAARLEPLHAAPSVDAANDPFLGIARRAKPSPKEKTSHADIDWILVSFATMHELRCCEAFTTDRCFKQAGFVPLLRG